MATRRDYLAVDLGASNGRVLAGRWDGTRFGLHEVHRFDNGPVVVGGSQFWDALRLWAEIKAGIASHAARGGGESRSRGEARGIGVDAWGVDVGFLDRAGRLLGNPWHYRDGRTDGEMERVFEVVPRATIYEATGIQFMQINTLYQLSSMVRAGDPQLEAAATLLPIPNLFGYWLSGVAAAEYTDATTTQCLLARERQWATAILDPLGIPTSILPQIVEPGAVLGALLPDVAAEVGLAATVPVVAVGSHDTASAVAAIPGLDLESAYISSGTWSLMGVEAAAPLITEASREAGFTNEGGVGGTIRLLRNIAGLWLVQECRRHWQRQGTEFSWEELFARAEGAEPFRSIVDPDSPEFLNPPNMPAALRAYCKADDQPLPGSIGQVVRCCLESLALRYRATLDELEGLVGHSLHTIRVVGGGSQNQMLCQMTADACGRPVVAGPVEAAALGNVMVQAIADGELDDVAAGRAAVAASVELRTYEPRPDDRWEEALARLRRPREAASA